jgi:ferredoxin
MNQCSCVRIYYFSGTGNAKHVATWIAEVTRSRGIPADIVNIADIDRLHIPPPPPGTLVGFCSPTHGFNLPPIMLYFLFRFPRGRNRVFMVNTRAGAKLGKLAVPGLSGLAQILPALLLLFKGYAIVGMRPIDLPSNWISLHPGLTDNAIDFLFRRFKRISTLFAERILDGRRDYRSLWDLPQDLLIAPIAIGYYFVGRFVFAKSFYASGACDNCGVCIKQCPVHAISLVDNRPFWSYRCESCMHCMNNCPKHAIETAHGYVIGLIVLLSIVAQPYLYDSFTRCGVRWFEESASYGAITRFALSAVVTFVVMVGTYRCVHYLRGRSKAFRVLMRYTSLTSFRFWRRYKPLTREMEKRGVL